VLVRGSKAGACILLLLSGLMAVQPVQASRLTTLGPYYQGPMQGIVEQLPDSEASGCFNIDGTYPFLSVDPDCLGPIPPGSAPPDPPSDSNSTAPPSNSTDGGP
jgi:hypothetical protein